MVLKLYSSALILLSLIAFFLYYADKRKAIQRAWRIPEKALLSLSFFGGAAGGYAAMLIFRHKTRHWYFHAVNWAGLIWQIGLLVFLILRTI